MMRKSHSLHTLGQNGKMPQGKIEGESQAGGDGRYSGRVGRPQVSEGLVDRGKIH